MNTQYILSNGRLNLLLLIILTGITIKKYFESAFYRYKIYFLEQQCYPENALWKHHDSQKS